MPDLPNDFAKSAYNLVSGDGRKLGGTGFFLGRSMEYFATARHIVDDNYRDNKKPYQLIKTLVLYGPIWRQENKRENTVFKFSIARWVFDPDDKDLAIAVIRDPHPVSCRPTPITVHALENDHNIKIGNDVVYFGYPDGVANIHHDNLTLVARRGILATKYTDDINVPNALGKSYGLIDSYAQNGFSGSPLWGVTNKYTTVETARSIERRKRNERIAAEYSTVPSISRFIFLGLICAHYRTNNDRIDGGHAGLSYYLKASRINKMISELVPKV